MQSRAGPLPEILIASEYKTAVKRAIRTLSRLPNHAEHPAGLDAAQHGHCDALFVRSLRLLSGGVNCMNIAPFSGEKCTVPL